TPTPAGPRAACPPSSNGRSPPPLPSSKGILSRANGSTRPGSARHRMERLRGCSATSGNGPAAPTAPTGLPAAGGRARRVQWEIHVRAARSARRFLRDSDLAHPIDLPQLLSTFGSLAVHRG